MRRRMCISIYFKDPTTHVFLCFDISVSCQCSTQEFYFITSTLSRLSTELQALMPAIQTQLSSALLKHLLLDTPQLLSPAHNFLKVLDEKAAKCVKSFDIFKNIYLNLCIFPYPNTVHAIHKARYEKMLLFCTVCSFSDSLSLKCVLLGWVIRQKCLWI